jgi:hypothetical protein
MMAVKQTGDPSRPESDFERISNRTTWQREGNRIRKEKQKIQAPDNLIPGDFGMTLDDIRRIQNGEDIEMAPMVWPYNFGDDLVEPSQVPKLPTQMRRLHTYYKS